MVPEDGDVLGDVLPTIDAGKHKIGRAVGQDFPDPHNDAVGRGTFNAKCRGPISRKRSGSLRDSECATPDWSFSGATIVTSSDNSRAINSRSLSPPRECRRRW